jgi:uncharacterized protein YndB with AHSA1/START domain
MTHTASLLTGGARPAVRLERHLPDPPAVVWKAVTEPDQLKAWFPCDLLVERWEVGQPIALEFHNIDLALSGEVLEVDEPNVLSFTWGGETLRIELTPEATGTRLVLIDELPAPFAARNAAGWEDCLDDLEGRPPAEGSWRRHFEEYAAEFIPVIGPQEGPPAGLEAS